MRQCKQARTLKTKKVSSKKRAWFLIQNNTRIEELDEDEIPVNTSEESEEKKKSLRFSF